MTPDPYAEAIAAVDAAVIQGRAQAHARDAFMVLSAADKMELLQEAREARELAGEGGMTPRAIADLLVFAATLEADAGAVSILKGKRKHDRR